MDAGMNVRRVNKDGNRFDKGDEFRSQRVVCMLLRDTRTNDVVCEQDPNVQSFDFGISRPDIGNIPVHAASR